MKTEERIRQRLSRTSNSLNRLTDSLCRLSRSLEAAHMAVEQAIREMESLGITDEEEAALEWVLETRPDPEWMKLADRRERCFDENL